MDTIWVIGPAVLSVGEFLAFSTRESLLEALRGAGLHQRKDMGSQDVEYWISESETMTVTVKVYEVPLLDAKDGETGIRKLVLRIDAALAAAPPPL